MSSIAFGGLATGLDTSSILAQLVELKRQPIYRLEARKKGYQAEISALGTLKSKLTALQDAAKRLDTASEFSSLKASSSDEDILQVTAGSKAAPGSYTIEVTSRAVAQKDMSQGYDSALDSVGSGLISFTVDGETTELNLVGFTSLTSLANHINDNVEGVGASILYDGSAAGGYRLVLSGASAGSAGAFTADFSGLSGGIPPVLATTTAAQDAQLLIDDVPVTATSNLVEDAISGLTLDLRGFEAGKQIFVEVSRDNEGTAELVKGIVDAYNDVFSFVKEQTAAEGALRDNATLRTVASSLESFFSKPLEGGTGSIASFSLIGITRGEGRLMKWDADDFTDALSSHYGAVRDLFIERDGFDGKMPLLDDMIKSLTDSTSGVFKGATKMLNQKIDNADDTIARYERSVESYRLTQERKFTAMELMVSQLQSQGSYLGSMVFG